jgi:hypothetical protein
MRMKDGQVLIPSRVSTPGLCVAGHDGLSERGFGLSYINAKGKRLIKQDEQLY